MRSRVTEQLWWAPGIQPGSTHHKDLEPYVFPSIKSLRYYGPSGSHIPHNLHWPANSYYLQTEGMRKGDCAGWCQHLSPTDISDTMTPATIQTNCIKTIQFHYAKFKLEMLSVADNQDL